MKIYKEMQIIDIKVKIYLTVHELGNWQEFILIKLPSFVRKILIPALAATSV
jgi:hypothetical protein